LATKRDAISFCVVLYVVALVALVAGRKPARLRLLAASAGVAALSTLPWRLHAALNGLEDRDVNLSVSRAFGRAGETPYVLGRFTHVALGSAYLGALPLAGLAAVLLLTRPRCRRLATGFLAVELGLLAALAFVYLDGVAGVHYLVRTSAARTLMTPTLLAAALLPLLLSRAFELEAEGPASDCGRAPAAA
jgi:hypothetical protein